MTGPGSGSTIVDLAMTRHVLMAAVVVSPVVVVTLVALNAAGGAGLAAREQSSAADLDDLLDKATDYVATYSRDFVGVVAEETYRQEVHGRSRTDVRGFPIEGARQTRELKSDMLLVRAPAGDRWLQFRDVFEIDGKAVRDRAERLARLFLQPSPSAQRQVEDITAESARYNIGGINRNINLPVLALAVLQAENRPWFSFNAQRRKDAVWDLEYREERTGTLIRTTGDQAMPARGRFSVERATGRVIASELQMESRELKARIDVTYAPEPSLGGLLVPREMREKYDSRDGSKVEGHAAYAKFRRYTVTVDEKIKK